MKKNSILVFIMMILLFSTHVVFASDVNVDSETELEGTKPSVEIMDLNTNENKEVVVLDDLFISLRFNKNITVDMDLLSKKNPLSVEEYKEMSDDSLKEYVINYTSYKKPSPEESLDSIITKNIEIIDSYFNSKESLLSTQKEYNLIVNKLNLFVSSDEILNLELDPIKKQKIGIQDNYKEVVKAYDNQLAEYLNNSRAFEKLFLKPVVQLREISYDGIMPYYEYTVENILEGEYSLVLMDSETKEEIYTENLKIVHHESVTDEKSSKKIENHKAEGIDLENISEESSEIPMEESDE